MSASGSFMMAKQFLPPLVFPPMPYWLNMHGINRGTYSSRRSAKFSINIFRSPGREENGTQPDDIFTRLHYVAHPVRGPV